ncbi:GNAT family N-acetyltransferase [Larsenimonas suaedae]|uniref:GNAT family N-acetyltransferase n=1 Tax=Larsenimonas suaedae TaxID=1851019 RepID=A0ABU1GU68_9GAMM|nr:GNAT family N-acetyltransferase [Larsenimonas suaedae]MCM2972019.1 GNAT family N-acetyltransferase [Larsenimonas suaedae]MDR5895571.1 GNAT family N-acetyltransferase [Larsenimonas suaedae]
MALCLPITQLDDVRSAELTLLAEAVASDPGKQAPDSAWCYPRFWKDDIGPRLGQDLWLWEARLNRELVGCLRLRRDGAPEARHCSWIEGIFVHPECDTTRIAQELLAAASTFARMDGTRHLTSWAASGFEHAVMKNAGWTPVGEIERFAASAIQGPRDAALYHTSTT